MYLTRSTATRSLLRSRFGLASIALVTALCAAPLGCDGLQPGMPDDGGADGGDDGAVPRAFSGVAIEPNNEVLLVDLNGRVTRDFRVYAVYTDNSRVDISDKVTLKLQNAAVGTLSGTRFESAVVGSTQVLFTTLTTDYTEDGQTRTGVANLTLVWLRQSGAQTDFFFTLPYNAAKKEQPLSFSTKIQDLDSFFAVDTTSSMGPSIIGLRDSLQATVLPGVQAAAVKGAWFGVGAIEDFPVTPYGTPNFRAGLPDDQPFILLSPMTADLTAAKNAVGNLLVGTAARGAGGDLPEGDLEALYQIATGAGNVVAGVVNVPPHKVNIGGVEFRKGALPVITLITDALFHAKNEATSCNVIVAATGTNTLIDGQYSGTVASVAHTRTEVNSALNNICAKVVGVSVLRTSGAGINPPLRDDPNGLCNASTDLTRVAQATGALVPPQAWDVPSRPAKCAAGLCCTGLDSVGENPGGDGLCPLVFKVPNNGTGLSAQVVSGITQLARYAAFDVTSETSGNTTGDKGERLPAGRTTADFLKAILPVDATVPMPPPVIKPPIIQGGRFTQVTPGTTVRFAISAQNDFQPETAQPQVFRAVIKILAGGCADLDQREVIILVPPSVPVVD